jgi:predicted acylesterase/phospholipase RssA
MKTAIVLSGGGARGDFQVGALLYLYGVGRYPQIICGSSVGAINGVKLAEDPGRRSFPNFHERNNTCRADNDSTKTS